MIPRPVSFTYTHRETASFARMLRDLRKELRIVGIGWRRIGVYIMWWHDSAAPPPAAALGVELTGEGR